MLTATRFVLERIVALDRAVKAGKFPNARSMSEGLEVDPRTIQRDIEFLRDRLGAPLEFDHRNNGYFYSDPGYRLCFLDLAEDELVALFLAKGAFEVFSGTGYADDLSRVVRKVAAGFVDPSPSHSFRLSASSPAEPALHRTIADAIRGRERLSIRYYSASSDEETRREVDPYHLANVDGQFYLVAYCHLRGCVRTFAPARIRSLECTGKHFDPAMDFRVDIYLADAFAVFRGVEGSVHQVCLECRGEAVRYVRERTWHPSQQVEMKPDGSLILRLAVGHLREVEKFALSWMPDCIVIGPQELRERISKILATASEGYLRSHCPSDPI